MRKRLGNLDEVVRSEYAALDVRLGACLLVCNLMPPYVGNRLRCSSLRLAGVRIGPATSFFGSVRIHGHGAPATRLRIGSHCSINGGIEFDVAAPIYLGDGVTIGHQVLLVTGGHQLGPSGRRAGPLEPRPVTLHDGCWIGARATVLAGVTIGRGAVVAAGAVVAQNVEPDTLVGGVPARLIRRLSTDHVAPTIE